MHMTEISVIALQISTFFFKVTFISAFQTILNTDFHKIAPG